MHSAIAHQGAQQAFVGEESFPDLGVQERMMVLMLDAQGQCEFVSPTWMRFTGRDMAQELGSGWLDHIHPLDCAELSDGLQKSVHDRQPALLRFRYRRGDGSYRWLENQCVPRTNREGHYQGQIGMCLDVTRQQDAQPEVTPTAQNIIAMLRQSPLIGVLLDHQGRVQFSNSGLCRLLQYSATELMDYPFFERFLAYQDPTLNGTHGPDGAQELSFPASFESELRARDQVPRHVRWHCIALSDPAGNHSSTVLIGDDITGMRQNERQLALAAKIFAATDQAMMITKLDGTIIATNQAFTQLYGYEESDVLGDTPRILNSGRQGQAFHQQLWSQLEATGHWHGDLWNRRKDASLLPVYMSISAIHNSLGKVTHYVTIFYDIAERKTFEDRLNHLAHYDCLTGIPNRCLFQDRLAHSGERAIRQNTKLGLLYIDLDRFKLINDTLGHSAGDELLVAVAKRLKASVRAVDTVARLGGDEFVVLIPDLQQPNDLSHVAEKILAALGENFEIAGTTVTTGASVGVGVFPDDCRDISELLKLADAAMYQGKRDGRGKARFVQTPQT